MGRKLFGRVRPKLTGVNLLRVIGALAIAGLLQGAPSASGSVTIGQLAPASATLEACSSEWDFLDPTVTSGNSYVLPGTGTVTSWSTAAGPGASQQMAMKIFRHVTDPVHPYIYRAVGHDGPHPLAANTLNSFAANIAVQPGDVVGVSTPTGANSPACQFDVPGEPYLSQTPPLADGAQGDFVSFSTCCRDNVTAVFDPSNTFTLGQPIRNKKKGTATITVNDIPNPGELTGSGKGATVASTAVTSKAVTPPGPATLTIKAKGKKKRTLNETGKVKLNVAVTYTPTGGSANTQSVKVKLKKKL
jgi:hypothetical protein